MSTDGYRVRHERVGDIVFQWNSTDGIHWYCWIDGVKVWRNGECP